MVDLIVRPGKDRQISLCPSSSLVDFLKVINIGFWFWVMRGEILFTSNCLQLSTLWGIKLYYLCNLCILYNNSDAVVPLLYMCERFTFIEQLKKKSKRNPSWLLELSSLFIDFNLLHLFWSFLYILPWISWHYLSSSSFMLHDPMTFINEIVPLRALPPPAQFY